MLAFIIRIINAYEIDRPLPLIAESCEKQRLGEDGKIMIGLKNLFTAWPMLKKSACKCRHS